MSILSVGLGSIHFTVLAHDLLLGPYPFVCFVKEYASCGNLDFGFGQQRPFTENQM